MMRVWLALVFLASTLSSQAAVFGYVQSNSLVDSSTVAYSGNVTGGHLLIAWYGAYNTAPANSTPAGGFSDTVGSSWSFPTCIFNDVGGGSTICLSLAIAKSTGADTVTLISPAASVNEAVMIGEYRIPASFTILVGQGCGWSAVAAYACGRSSFTIVQYGIIPPGTEYMAITGFFDDLSIHSWNSSTGATVEQQPVMTVCGCSIGFGDHDLTTTVILTSPYSDNYGSGFTFSFDMVGLSVLLVAAGQSAYGTAQ